MTVILYRVAEENVVTLTDTLVSRRAGQPAGYCHKLELFPHLDAAAYATGDARFLWEWSQYVRMSLAVRDVDELSEVASLSLCDVWHAIGCDTCDDPTIVYLFGAMAGGCRGYSYDSDRGFEPVPCPDGAVGIRPAPNFADYSVDTIDGWIQVAVRLQQQKVTAEQRAHGQSDAHIGGDLMLTVLAPGALSVTRVHRFADFDTQWEAIRTAELLSR